MQMLQDENTKRGGENGRLKEALDEYRKRPLSDIGKKNSKSYLIKTKIMPQPAEKNNPV